VIFVDSTPGGDDDEGAASESDQPAAAPDKQ
jgi:hypothetical protein